MKVFVYTISKNEAANADSFMENMRDADGVFVLDTGSTDDTVRQLRKHGATVRVRRYKNFRFDKARNDSLKLVPEENAVCVCPDLDERFDVGWRDKLERAWKENTDRARYRYVWSVNADGSDGVTFLSDKIHWRHGYRWAHPVHETLKKIDGAPENFVNTDVVLKHFPDNTKSRSSYLPLLELAVRESPLDDRSAHYLGREYMFRRRYAESIRELTRHLSLKTAVWQDERCASLRMLGKCFSALGQSTEAGIHFLRAIAEAPLLREPYFDLAEFLYSEEEWYGVLHFMGKAIKLARSESYITDPRCYGPLPYDYLSMAAYYAGNLPLAADYAETALSLGGDERISNNLKLFRAKK